MGKVVKPNKAAIIRTTVMLLFLKLAVRMQLRIAAIDSQIKTHRRSYLSASQPIGYCAIAPPKTKVARK